MLAGVQTFSGLLWSMSNALHDYLRDGPEFCDLICKASKWMFLAIIVGGFCVVAGVGVHYIIVFAPTIIWLAKVGAAIALCLLVLYGLGHASGSGSVGSSASTSSDSDTLNKILEVEQQRLALEKRRDMDEMFRRMRGK